MGEDEFSFNLREKVIACTRKESKSMAVPGVKEEAGAEKLPQQLCPSSVSSAACVGAAHCLWNTHLPMPLW